MKLANHVRPEVLALCQKHDAAPLYLVIDAENIGPVFVMKTYYYDILAVVGWPSSN